MSLKRYVSFVHGYEGLLDPEADSILDRPALWHLDEEVNEILSYPFPRNPNDFNLVKDKIVGEMPLILRHTSIKNYLVLVLMALSNMGIICIQGHTMGFMK